MTFFDYVMEVPAFMLLSLFFALLCGTVGAIYMEQENREHTVGPGAVGTAVIVMIFWTCLMIDSGIAGQIASVPADQSPPEGIVAASFLFALVLGVVYVVGYMMRVFTRSFIVTEPEPSGETEDVD